MRHSTAGTFGVVFCLLGGAIPLSAQFSDSVTIVPNPHYAAGSVREFLLGSGYRDLWATPVRVPVLDLDTFAGGLEPVERGGGQQTRSLRLLGKDRREYNFRSVDKFVTPDPRADLRETVVGDIVQDQISALHPAAAIVATGLLDAVAILNPGPVLAVMPDDPRLGEFREEFGGLLGTLELHVNEAEDGSPDFAGAVDVDGSEDVLAAVAEGPADRIDTRAYLRERLMSLLMKDWDRHAGQFRWAAFDSAGLRVWRPVPEDRDYAFSDYDGRFTTRLPLPQVAPFTPTYSGDLAGLMTNSSEIDRRLLAGLEWEAWEDALESVRRPLTDEAIEAAVRRMPPELYEASGPGIIARLQSRRDLLPVVAREFYDRLTTFPEIHGTEAAEVAEIQRRPDGDLRVTIRSETERDGESILLLDRTFLAEETEEVWVYLHGGDDRAAVAGGSSKGPLLRVVGGAGDDELTDASEAGLSGPRTVFHDAEGENAFEVAAGTVVIDSPFDDPAWVPGEVIPPRDWGSDLTWFAPWAAYEETQGIVVGGGPSWTQYGFRRFPYAGRVGVRGMVGLTTGRVGVDATGEFLGIGAVPDVSVHVRASQLEDVRFQGFGNASPEMPRKDAVLYLSQILLEAKLRYTPAEGMRLGVGPLIERLEPEVSIDPPFPLSASDLAPYGKAGLAGEIALRSDLDGEPGGRGFTLRADGRFFPEAWDLSTPFGRLSVAADASVPLPARTSISARAGGGQVWGDAPLFDLMYLGGWPTLRGFPAERFVGDALVYGGLELRSTLARVNLLVRGDLGLLALYDVGRVYLDGQSPGGWHTAPGFGIWFESLGYTASATMARGEGDRIYLRLEVP